jgi:3-hydroxy acid dehydrogenase / malonic semialdehyde reductase
MKILITGASSGIGRATALLLSQKGHEVFMVSRKKDVLENLARESASVIGSFVVDELDVTNQKSVKAFVERHQNWLQDVDVLINNAGLALGREPFQESSMEDVGAMIDTNVTGVLRLTREILPFMIRKKSGHIVNLGSVAGDTPYKGGTVYCATKAAVHMITDSLRMDLGGTGIRVSTISPGRVAETNFSNIRFKGDTATAAKIYEGYRTLKASEVAESINWVLSQPEHVNIQELVILPTDQPSATSLDPLKS